MMRSIAIIGAGQLGSRHLQSLADIDGKDFEIAVFDPSNESLLIAEERYNQVKKDKSPQARFVNHFDALPKELFLAIVATGSMVRRKVVEQLLDYTKVEYLILEKFLFPKLEDYDVIENLIREKEAVTYVNTPRRTFDFYKEIKPQLNQPFQLDVSGISWGLGCNAIHFVDLFAYLGDCTEFEIINNLDEQVIESKRAGYIEFTGNLTLIDKTTGNTCSLYSFKEGNRPSIVTITDPSKRIIVHESALSKILIFEEGENGFEYRDKGIRIPFQSQLTSVLVNDIVQKGTSELPSYRDSALMHRQLLKVYLEQYSKYTKQKEKLCPRT